MCGMSRQVEEKIARILAENVLKTELMQCKLGNKWIKDSMSAMKVRIK